MSKSIGNTVEPQVVTQKSGAEILRLWAALADYSEDQRIGATILQTTTDAYRKLRNTIRYLLGSLDGFDSAETIAVGEMPPLERFVLHRVWELDRQVRTAYQAYRFYRRDPAAGRLLHQRIVVALLRYPTRRALLRSAGLGAAEGLSDGDGRGLHEVDDLALAAGSLHHGGGVGHAFPR